MIGEILVSLAIFCVALFLYIHSFTLETFEAYQKMGADFWPQIILIGLMFCGAILTVRHIVQWKKSKAGEQSKEEVSWIRFTVFFGIIIGYVLLLKTVGFICLTPVLIFCIMMLIGAKRIKTYVFSITGIMLLVYVAFGRLLFVPLPKGHGIFRTISIALGL
ncbi:MAG: tripartite tricarboxylate transporter TctB family protein [Desulfatiglandaceae bacterium]